MFNSFVHFFRAAIEELQDIRLAMIVVPENDDGKKWPPALDEGLQHNLDYWKKLSQAVHLEGTKCLADDLLRDLKAWGKAKKSRSKANGKEALHRLAHGEDGGADEAARGQFLRPA